MKIRFLTAIAASLFTLLLTSCGEKKPELHIYNWSDYFAEDTLKEFEKRFGVKVIYDVIDSNETMYAKLRAGASGYDVVFPSSYSAYLMNQEGMLLELDHSKLPNLRYIDPEFSDRVALDKQFKYSVPFMSGTTGLAIRTDKVAEYEPTWALLARSDLAGRMTLLDDNREVIGAALCYLGYSVNSTNPDEINKATDLVIEWKRNIAKFAADEYKPGVASGEFYIVHGYSGDIMQVMDENEGLELEFILPKEGFSFWTDDMVILKDAPNPDLAHAFINFLHEPEIAAANMTFNNYLAPNTAAYELVDPELREDPMVFIPNELLEKGEQIMPLGDADKLYMEAWSRIRSAR